MPNFVMHSREKLSPANPKPKIIKPPKSNFLISAVLKFSIYLSER